MNSAPTNQLEGPRHTAPLGRGPLVEAVAGELTRSGRGELCLLVVLGADPDLLARRLATSCRPSDRLVRAGSIIGLVCRATSARAGAEVATRIRLLLGAEGDAPVRVGVRPVGHDEQVDAEQVVAHAWQAARDGGVRGGPARAELGGREVAGLAEALDAGQIVAWFQPLVEVPSGRVVGAEALARWNHPSAGILAPDRFLSEAHRRGLTPAIDAAVLRNGLAALARWRHQGLELGVLNVNTTAATLTRPGLVEWVLSCLARHRLEPGLLCLEIHEDSIDQVEGDALHSLLRLSEAGVHVAVDDFGTGRATLAHLVDLPASVLKLDRRFVGELPESGEAASIVRASASLASSLGLHQIAEGVERTCQIPPLLAAGCTVLQGFLFSAPVPPEGMSALVRRGFAEELAEFHWRSSGATRSGRRLVTVTEELAYQLALRPDRPHRGSG